MFQRKTESQSFVAQRRADPVPQPHDGTVLPPATKPDWGPGVVDLRDPQRGQHVVDATVIDESLIGSDLKIVGNVLSKGRVKLEGIIEGDMHCHSLVVGPTGSVTGSIVAEDVAVYGRVAGTVRGKSVNLYASAHVEGDIFHQGIGIEMGTHYDGRLKWSQAPIEGQSTAPALEQQ